MILVDPKVEVENFDPVKLMKRIERACRTCYRSEDKITEDSYKTLITNCIKRGHESVLEHEKITVRLTTNLSCYKDLTRHRICNFSIESTRYCNYSKDKFGSQLKLIRPFFYSDSEKFELWSDCMNKIEDTYTAMSNLDCRPDEMRMVLPHSVAAEVTMTANVREWRHILSLRASNRAHPDVRQVMIPLLKYFKEKMPELFGDISYDEEFPYELASITEMED